MNSPIAGIIIGGVIPALVFGVFGVLQKVCLRAGLGIGPFFVTMGGTVALVGLLCCLLTGRNTVTAAAGLSGIGTGLVWSLGTGLVLLALGRFGASVSQLAPLYNTNTLVVVLLGMFIFSEWKQVHPVPLVIGAGLIVLGAALVARA